MLFVLKEIEGQVKNVNSHNVIWLRWSPGVGNSALVTSIVARLQNQNRYVISLQSDRTQSAIVTTDALLRTVTCGLACLNLSVRRHVQYETPHGGCAAHLVYP